MKSSVLRYLTDFNIYTKKLKLTFHEEQPSATQTCTQHLLPVNPVIILTGAYGYATINFYDIFLDGEYISNNNQLRDHSLVKFLNVPLQFKGD